MQFPIYLKKGDRVQNIKNGKEGIVVWVNEHWGDDIENKSGKKPVEPFRIDVVEINYDGEKYPADYRRDEK